MRVGPSLPMWHGVGTGVLTGAAIEWAGYRTGPGQGPWRQFRPRAGTDARPLCGGRPCLVASLLEAQTLSACASRRTVFGYLLRGSKRARAVPFTRAHAQGTPLDSAPAGDQQWAGRRAARRTEARFGSLRTVGACAVNRRRGADS
ncbi:hypothetical protein GA0115244_106838 [Streptomyces sp. DvalAA-19]|nr:hypothetical protein GA0115244_106838 [Streptomyces sp. DvalAA-19]